jgi:UDP-N-acetylmuramoyl-tripeptide--D-alanyl-D-alanine ligase
MAAMAPGEVVTFALDAADARVRGTGVATDALGHLSLDVSASLETVHIATRLVGAHHAINVLAAVAAGVALGFPLGSIAAALDQVEPSSPHRMAVSTLADGAVLIDDSYNANPSSMRAGLEAAAAMAARTGRTVWAVLGEMRELGAAAVEEHEAVGREAAGLGIGRLITVGEGAKPIADGARDAGMSPEAIEFWPGADGLAQALAQHAGKEHIILIKGSHGSGLWRVAERLTAKELGEATC